MYKGTPIPLSLDFSGEAFQAQREQHNIFKVLKEKNCQEKLFDSAKLSFGTGEIVFHTSKS